MKLLAKTVRSSNGVPQFEIKYKERPYRVKMYKFQENYPDDTPIECVMIRQSNGDLYFRQDLKSLISEYYTIGETYEFNVKHDFSHNGYYELIDERGITFRLPVPKGMKLLTGSSIRCKLISIDSSGGQIRLSDTSSLIPADGVGSYEINRDPFARKEIDARSFADRVFADLYPEEDPSWDPDILFGLLFLNDDYYNRAVNNELLEFINSWLFNEDLEWEDVYQRLDEIRRAVMYVLEGSDILLSVEPLRRKSLQQRLTVIADNIVGYRRAADHLRQGESAKIVNRVLNCLRTSGYIYEAEYQLDLMMKIFSLSAEVMVANMNQIFSIIHARSEEFWHDEPFRKAFIRLLQMYVEQASRGIESGAINDTLTIRSLIEALSIQLLLADRETDADLFDYNLNLAALYRYSSMLRTSVPENAVRNAFLALMDVTRRPGAIYRWSETGAHDLIASKLTAMPVGLEDHFEKVYESLPVALRISIDAILISRKDVKPEILKTIELNGVGIWPRLRIMTPQKIATVSNSNDLRRARDMWNAIEKSLFSLDIDIKRPLPQRRTVPRVDDECQVRVISQIDETRFMVEITNDENEGRGILATDDIVQYKIANLRVSTFCDEEGHPFIFTAKVKSIDETGLHFTILEPLLEFSQRAIQNDNPLRCIIKSSNQYGKVGVSEWGDAVKFKPTGEFASIKAGDVVIGNFWSIPSNVKERNYIEGVVTEIIEDPDPFSTVDAFHSLLSDYADDIFENEPDEIPAPVDNMDAEEMLSDSRLAELMLLVERKAAGENDYMKAFNHIGFARLLARLARNERRREFYEAWMRLISILHHFAINGEIDTTRLSEFEENDRSHFDPNSELFLRYLQLKVVSYKGQPQMREEIWKYMGHEDEGIRNLASNIMAYNLIAENSSASVLGEINDRINNILHVNARKSTLHSFGSENKTTEFKSSLIYPPNNHMRANPELQTIEIMKEICALLNADGGTLYIGVNDFGMGVGIENDLAYKEFNGSEDKYDLYFRHAVCRILGRDADAYIDSKFETFGGKRIYIIRIRPYYTYPLKVEGVIYERHGSSKLPFYDSEEIRLFTERRSQERERLRAKFDRKNESVIQELSNQSAETSGSNREETSSISVKSPIDGVGRKSESSERVTRNDNPERIPKRAGSPICPAIYDPEHDPATERYLEIRKDEFQLIPEFYGYSDDDDDLLLTLPLSNDNRKDWLMLGYADGTICRVPMRFILDKQDYLPGKRFTDVPLIFADIMKEDEALITLSQNANGNWNARADRIDAIPEVTGLRAAGDRIFNTVKERYLYNIMSSAKSLNYQDLFNRTNKDAGKNFTSSRHDRLYQQLHRDGFIG